MPEIYSSSTPRLDEEDSSESDESFALLEEFPLSVES
jgi:hypothetical protein